MGNLTFRSSYPSEQRFRQNRETTNIGLDGSIGKSTSTLNRKVPGSYSALVNFLCSRTKKESSQKYDILYSVTLNSRRTIYVIVWCKFTFIIGSGMLP